MPSDPPEPKIKLSRLRDIGWRIWDPIGIASSDARWDHPENRSFADEYDSYLVAAASQLRRGVSREQVVEYLLDVEIKNMGLGERADCLKRAEAVVEAILDDETIWSWTEQ